MSGASFFSFMDSLYKKISMRVIIVLMGLCLCNAGFAQTEKPTYNYFNKGQKFWSIGLSPVYSDMVGSYTDVSISKGNTNLGILLAPMKAKFVEQNLMLGVMGIVGMHTEQSTFFTYPITIGPGPVPPVDTKSIMNNLDLGIAPIIRYYMPLTKRNTLAFFLQGGLPLIYSKQTNTLKYLYGPGIVDEFKTSTDQLALRGSIGFGLSVQANFGSIDSHVSNMGWFLSFNKFINQRKGE
jgi:hypothetical protein